jgi:hypothetical protein
MSGISGSHDAVAIPGAVVSSLGEIGAPTPAPTDTTQNYSSLWLVIIAGGVLLYFVLR